VEVEQQLPMLRDEEVTSFVASIGTRLVQSIPEELRHSEFQYSFQVVNVREINAFALPGGPMYVNRGMIAAAHSQGEVAGVMAHELSHVALRHGTAQATKATKPGRTHRGVCDPARRRESLLRARGRSARQFFGVRGGLP